MASDTSNYAKTWELNVYELNRVPHEVITDDTEIAVSPKSLHNELMCPICLDILKSTMTTKECLHRFCHDCIITALRAGNKECPTCRKKLISKRSLRPDPNFDALISKIYPNREEYDALHEKVLEKFSKKHLNSNNQGVKTPKEKRNQRNRVNNSTNNANQDDDTVPRSSRNETNSDEMPHTATTTSSAKASSTNESSRKRTISEDSDMESRTSTERSNIQTEQDEIEVILKPHPKETQHISQRYLKTTHNATIAHLSKYLHTRLCIESNKIDSIKQNEQNVDTNLDFNISICNSNSQYQVLNGQITLEQVLENHWKVNKPLELYYSAKNTSV